MGAEAYIELFGLVAVLVVVVFLAIFICLACAGAAGFLVAATDGAATSERTASGARMAIFMVVLLIGPALLRHDPPASAVTGP